MWSAIQIICCAGCMGFVGEIEVMIMMFQYIGYTLV